MTDLKITLAKLAHITFWNWFQFVVVLLLSSYTFIASQVPYRNAEEISKLHTEIQQLERTYLALSESIQTRVQALESTTYVDVLSELKKRSPAQSTLALERWEKNREAIIDKRLDTLERWRYTVDGKLQDGKLQQ
jgi:hypothetical protein